MNYDESSTLFFNAVNAKNNILLHGPAGTGKSYLLKDYISCLEDIDYYIVAPTGIAAINISGETIHRTFNISPYNISSEENKCEQIKTIVKNCKPLFKSMDLLIIDEISMVGRDLLAIVDGVLRNKFCSNLPMGGVQCIFSGDFYQLCPVKDDYCFKSDLWQELNLVNIPMSESKRYNEDFTFQFMLRLRKNLLTVEDKELIHQRNLAYKNKEYEQLNIKPVVLYSYNADVDKINAIELSKIQGKEYVYNCFDKINNLKECDKKKYITQIRKLLNESLVKKLKLKVGASIVFIRNYNFDSGLVNGKLAKIIEINHPIDSAEITTNEMTKEFYVMIELITGEQYKIFPYENTINSFSCKFSRLQYPFKLAWALTNYKAQGMSLDAAIVDISNVFNPGQTYTTLSRVRDINNLFIINYNFNKILVNRFVANNFQ